MRVTFTHTTFTKGTSRADWLRSDLHTWGLPASQPCRRAKVLQVEAGKGMAVPLTHAKLGVFEIQGVTNLFAPLLIWAFVTPDEAF